MPPISIDSTINLEGVVAAIGILAAAIGYIFSLIRTARDNRQWKLERADNIVILEILESDPVNGLNESEIMSYFKKPEYQQLIKQLKASRPEKLKMDYLESRLRNLQYESFLDRTLARKYVLRTRYEYKPDELTQREIEIKRHKMEYLSSKLKVSKLIEILKINMDEMEIWDRRNAIRAFAAIGNDVALDELINHLESKEPKVALATALEISEILRDGERYTKFN
jgi:hypothetical protein